MLSIGEDFFGFSFLSCLETSLVLILLNTMLGWFLYLSTACSIGSSIFLGNERLALFSVNSNSSVIFAKYSLSTSAIFIFLKEIDGLRHLMKDHVTP